MTGHKRLGLAFLEVRGLSSGRMLQDQMRADSQYEQLLSWILNGEKRGVRQAQTPAKKDLENRRDLWLRKGTYIMISPEKRKRDAIA